MKTRWIPALIKSGRLTGKLINNVPQFPLRL